jgi:hypothetical protein
MVVKLAVEIQFTALRSYLSRTRDQAYTRAGKILRTGLPAVTPSDPPPRISASTKHSQSTGRENKADARAERPFLLQLHVDRDAV